MTLCEVQKKVTELSVLIYLTIYLVSIIKMRSSKSEKLLTHGSTDGVGARHKETDASEGGGRYLGNCTYFNFSNGDSEGKKIFADLKKSGLPDIWLKVLDVIGPIAFLKMWYELDGEVTGSGENRICVPAISKFVRIRRNQLINELSRKGQKPSEIVRNVKRVTGKNISEKTVLRVLDE